MHKKLTENKAYHRRLIKRRSATVEPVLDTLIDHHNMKRINARGMSAANKHVLMASLCYNLKKYLKFSRKLPQTAAIALQKNIGQAFAIIFSVLLQAINAEMRALDFYKVAVYKKTAFGKEAVNAFLTIAFMKDYV